MSYNDTLHKTELAFSAVLATVATAQSLVRRVGLDTNSKDKASVTVTAESAEPYSPASANRMVTVAVTIKTNMDDATTTQHKTKVQAVFDVLIDTAIAATLDSAISDFACFHVEQVGEQQSAVDRSHETQARFLCHVAPSDIV